MIDSREFNQFFIVEDIKCLFASKIFRSKLQSSWNFSIIIETRDSKPDSTEMSLVRWYCFYCHPTYIIHSDIHLLCPLQCFLYGCRFLLFILPISLFLIYAHLGPKVAWKYHDLLCKSNIITYIAAPMVLCIHPRRQRYTQRNISKSITDMLEKYW